MNTAFLIYLVMQLDSLNSVLTTLATLALAALVAVCIANAVIWDDVVNPILEKPNKKRLDDITSVRKRLTVLCAVLALIATLTPSTKTAIYMVGGSATIEALQSEEAKEIGGKVLELLQKKLDEELNK